MRKSNPQIAQIGTDTDQRDPERYAIISAAMAVYRGLKIEFAPCGIPHEQECDGQMSGRHQPPCAQHRVDFVCDHSVVVETKALSPLSGTGRPQVINDLKTAGDRQGLLMNFGTPSLQSERFVL